MDENVLVWYPEGPGKPSEELGWSDQGTVEIFEDVQTCPSFSASYRMLPGLNRDRGVLRYTDGDGQIECEESGLNVIRDIMYVVDSHSEKVSSSTTARREGS